MTSPKRKARIFFSLMQHLPKFARDYICQSRINIPPLSNDLVFEIAKSQQDLDQAFEILHDAYVKEGFSKPQPSRRRVTDYHALPSTSTLVAKFQDQVVATISLIRDSIFGLPIDAAIDLSHFRKQGERLGEVSSLAIRSDFRGRSGEVLFHLFKYTILYSIDYFGLDRYVIVVNPDRISLYESVILCKRIRRSAMKAYAFANNAPGVCATLNLNTAPEAWRRVYHGKPAHKNMHQFFLGGLSEGEERQMHFPDRPFFTASDPVMSPELMDYFFNRCTDALCRFKPHQVRAVQSIYAGKEYDEVWPNEWKADQTNRRISRRFDVACAGIASDPAHDPVPLKVMDASRSGLRVRATAVLPASAAPVLDISVGKEKSVQVKACMRWQSGALCGMEIVRGHHSWEQFVDYLENQIPCSPFRLSEDRVPAT